MQAFLLTMSNVILTASEMQALEQRAFAEGIDQEGLMDVAGIGIARHILRRESQRGICILYLGRGNNAGDALVAGSVLQNAGWSVLARFSDPPDNLGPLPRKKLRSFGSPPRRFYGDPAALSQNLPIILVDGILGIGSRPGLSPELKVMTREMNYLRSHLRARAYAVDVPTGVSEDGADADSIVADITLTIGFPKRCLLRDDVTNFVGKIQRVPLRALTERVTQDTSRDRFTDVDELRGLLPSRKFDSHKGDFGRIGIVAGSLGFVGAGVLCSQSAVRAGGGLVTLYTIVDDSYPLLAVKAAPEVMVKPVHDYREVLDDRLTAIAIGPGLGTAHQDPVLDIVRNFDGPMVVDADALNLVSRQTETLSKIAGPRLLTPHPGEMKRLWPVEAGRPETVRAFTNRFAVALLLKGARTLVGQKGKPLSYNATGTPGMATGGSGDVLTGVCGALLGQHLEPYDAARLGAWLCGRAAELAVETESEESMLPSDTLRYLGQAFKELRDETR
jgi:ADP-dependent NAD(P)H-hydrate dehydratase / NAD(P)H-hydrate epimerase